MREDSGECISRDFSEISAAIQGKKEVSEADGWDRSTLGIGGQPRGGRDQREKGEVATSRGGCDRKVVFAKRG